MKKILLLLLILTSIFSCTKDKVVDDPNLETYFAKSNDGGREGDEDEPNDDDDDHDYGECCSFKYGQWSDCVAGYQVRSWSSRSSSCVPPIDSIQRTCQSAIVQYFYYNPQYGVRIVCNYPGMIHIYNSLGQLTSVLYYNAGAFWITISFLPPGAYTFKTYYRTITLTI